MIDSTAAIARPGDPPGLGDPLRLTAAEWTARFAAVGVSTLPAAGDRPGPSVDGAAPMPIALDWTGGDTRSVAAVGQPITLEQFLGGFGRGAPAAGDSVPSPSPIGWVVTGERGLVDGDAVPLPAPVDATATPGFGPAFGELAARFAATMNHLGLINVLQL